MSSTPHQVFTKDEIKGFVSQLMQALGRAHTPTDATDNKTRERRTSIDKAILRGELAREKRQLVKEVARDPTATNKDLVDALGGDSAVTPLQLARLVKADHTPISHDVGVAPRGDFMRRVLGSKPSAKELSWYSELVDASGGRISASPSGEVMIDGGVPLEGTNLIAVLQYLTRGARGRSKPTGVEVVGQVLQEGGVRSSGFTPTVISLLGGKSSRAAKHTPPRQRASSVSSPRQFPRLPIAPEKDDDSDSGDDSDGGDPLTSQTGEGLLRRAMDQAEDGDHDAAFDCLTRARMARAPRDLVKKAEGYLSHLHDGI